MNKEECESLILQKLKEIKAIAKKYDKSKEFYLSMGIYDDCMTVNNSYWETETPLDVIEYDNGKVIHCEH